MLAFLDKVHILGQISAEKQKTVIAVKYVVQ